MNESPFLFWSALLCFMIIPWPMLIVSYFYVNNPKHKKRLVELGYGLNNDWIKGKRIDFVDSTMLFTGMPLVAYILKVGHYFGKTNLSQIMLHPNIHRNQNYIKLWQEFRFYCVWTMIEFCICMFGAVCAFIFYGIEHDWF